ncbi:MAG TPA: GDSL-type esterase/lipase family protein [Chloroflexota bacterium]|nr:GDSL-type esterase/lipase family protein [Chloroflexota bacterium]
MNVVEAFLARHTPVHTADTQWPMSVIRVAAYVSDAPLPPEIWRLATSVRCVVLRRGPDGQDEVLVLRNRHSRHALPGGRREPGEAPRETITRELMEEAGCRVGPPRRIGFMHLRHVGDIAAGHPYTAPDFFWPIYAAEAVTYDPAARPDDVYEEASEFVPVSALETLGLEPHTERFVRAAVDALQNAAASYTAPQRTVTTDSVAPPGGLIFGPDQKLLFIGDSITDCGRRGDAEGKGPHVPYGNGYVHLIRALLLARYGELGLEIVNRGISGNTVRDLDRRWEDDVIAEQPDWLSVKIGINDVWRLIANRMDAHVPLDEYEATLRRLLDRTKAATKARLILMEPYVIAPPVPGSTDEDPVGPAAAEAATGMSLEQAKATYQPLRDKGVSAGPELEACLAHFRAVMDQYRAVVRRLAAEHAAVLVRTQAAYDAALEKQPPTYWAADRVHPGAPGHAVIARAFLRAVGYGDV